MSCAKAYKAASTRSSEAISETACTKPGEQLVHTEIKHWIRHLCQAEIGVLQATKA